MFRTEKPWVRIYEGHVSPETEVYEGSLTDLLRVSVEEHRDKVALTFYGATFDFAHLGGLTEKMAASLASRGVKKGDRVALMLPNCPQYAISFFATVRLGAIVTQINPMYVEREIEHILEDSGAETIVVYSEAYPRVKAVIEQTRLRNVVVVHLEGELEELDREHHSFDDFIEIDADPVPEIEITPSEDVAALQYTGGTTGVSKGAMLTHFNLVANVQQTADLFVDDPAAFSSKQKIMAVLPLFHIYGLTCGMLFGIRQGLNQLLLPRFDADEVMDLVKEEGPIMFAGVPTMYVALVSSGADLKRYRFDEVRTFNSGGSALPVNLKRAFEEKTGRVLFEGYGLSEASPVTHLNPPFIGQGREGSIGVPIPSTDARIVDVETGTQEQPVGEPGELVIRGPQVMRGYWQMPEETSDTLRDGWLHTGDIARMDEQGYLYIVDRKKEVINTSGFKVYPREVEEILYQHPEVVEAVAVGVPDEYRGETVKAFVVKKQGGSVKEQDIISYCKESLAPYKVPKVLEFRDELPKSAVGKLLRRVLADEEREKAGVPPKTGKGVEGQ